jgi:hypothetical protein
MATSKGVAKGHMDGHKGGKTHGVKVKGKTGSASGKKISGKARGHHSILFGDKKNTKQTKGIKTGGLTKGK